MTYVNTNIINRAIIFATEKHAGETRDNGMPYFFHPYDVMQEVVEHSGLTGQDLEDAMVAALLHDTVEDTDTTFEEVESIFGKRIVDLVKPLSKNEALAKKYSDSLCKKVVLKDTLDRLKKSPVPASVVKMGDRTSNLKDFPRHWTKEKVSNYIEEGQIIADTLRKASEKMYQRLMQQIQIATGVRDTMV